MRWCWAAVALVALGGAERACAQKGKRELLVEGKSVNAWAKDLEGKDLLARLRAVNALMQAGPEARSATATLLAVFGEKDATLLHPLAAVALSRVGADAVPALTKGLASKSASVRGGAALALGLIGTPAAPAAEALAKALWDDDDAVRLAAARALGLIGPAAFRAEKALADAMKDADAAVRVEAAWALNLLASGEKGLPTLQAALQSDNSSLVMRAIDAISHLGPRAKSAEPALREAMKSKDALTRIAAAEALHLVTGSADMLPLLLKESEGSDKAARRAALAAIGSLDDDAAAKALTGRLGDKDADLRREAAAALVGPAGAKADRAALERGLGDADLGVRWWCALALAAQPGDVRKREEDILRALRRPLFRADEEAVKPLLDVHYPTRGATALGRVLKSRPVRFQIEAARSLGQLGLDTRLELPNLIEALATDDKLVRRAVADALASIGVEAIPRLTRLLGDADSRRREGAARALGRLGLPARSAVPALERMLKDPDAAARSRAAFALWTTDRNGDLALAVLSLVLKDVDNADRWEAIEAIGTIGAEARPPIKGIFEILANSLKDRDVRVRVQAARQLWRRERQAKVVVPLLREAAADRDALARLAAVETLGELGGDERAVALLFQALEDKDISVRLAAEEGLARGGAVPGLLEALGSKSSRVRMGAIRAVGLIGAPAKAARGRLEKLAGEGDAAEREAARESLRLLEGRTGGG